jgi:serine phosphatase RsbU (regulator of sigma subunit)
MKMRYAIFILCLVVLPSSNCFAFINAKDSLTSILNADTSSFQTKIDCGYKLAKKYQWEDNTDSSIIIMEQLLDEILLSGSPQDLIELGIRASGLSKVYSYVQRHQFLGQALNASIYYEDSLSQFYIYERLGQIYFEAGDSINCRIAVLKSDSISQSISNQEDFVGALVNNTYRLYNLKYYDESLKLINRAYHIEMKRTNGDYLKFNTSVLSWLALVHTGMDNPDSTIHYSLISLRIAKESGKTNDLANAYKNASFGYQMKKEFEPAFAYHDSSLQLYVSMERYVPATVVAYNMASWHSELGEYNKAAQIYDRVIKDFLPHTSPGYVAEIYKHANKVYAKVGRKIEAYDYLSEYLRITDSLDRNNPSNEFDQYLEMKSLEDAKKEADYEKRILISEQEKKDEIAKAEINRKNAILIGTAVGVLTLIILLILIYRNYRNKKKSALEIQLQKDQVEEAHKEIQDSIIYAKRIQGAILPSQKMWNNAFVNSFILYKPKDIVAGDFYWMEPQKDRILFAAADCTGHGVPGAMVSVICNNGLNRSTREFSLSDPGDILTKTRELVIQEFEKSEEEVKDGMDIALCSLEGNQLKYAGAYNPLWIIRKGSNEVEEIKADKQPIGKYAEPRPFTSHSIQLNPGDNIYTFSDGFADQFGGEKGKKFKAKNFKSLLLSIQNESMDRQKELIDEAFEKWQGKLEQLDDVCVIGVRV